MKKSITAIFALFTGSLFVLLPSCDPSFHAYVSNKTSEDITVTYRPYSLIEDTSGVIANKHSGTSKRPDSIFYLSRNPGIYSFGTDGKLVKAPANNSFPDLVQVELKPGQLLSIGDLPTYMSWDEVFRITELTVIKQNQSTTIKDPRKNFVKKKKVGVIFEIK
ncbi:MAG TPA: hypothetical protein VI112_18335 [Bacteroidia bacterium]|jgi:hypothetical protein